MSNNITNHHDETRLNVLHLLQATTHINHRVVNEALGVSLEKFLKTLGYKISIKVMRIRKSKNKPAYFYLLTLLNIAENWALSETKNGDARAFSNRKSFGVFSPE